MQILIGSYTHDSDSPGVLRLRFDPSQGRLEPEPLQALTSHNLLAGAGRATRAALCHP